MGFLFHVNLVLNINISFDVIHLSVVFELKKNL